MPIIKKFAPTENLDKYEVFILEEGLTSQYFKITEFAEVFTGGKNGFAIEGSPHLLETTEIKLEIKDVEGDAVYYEPGRGTPDYYEGNSAIVSVHVYNDTPIGEATLIVLGELKTYIDPNGVSRPVPTEWRGVYNVRYERKFKLNKLLPNEDIVRFYRRPIALVNEVVKPIINITENPRVDAFPVNGQPITPGFNTDIRDYKRPIRYRLTISGSNEFYRWNDGVVGNRIRIPDLDFSANVLEIVSEDEIIVDNAYTTGSLITQFTSSVSHPIVSRISYEYNDDDTITTPVDDVLSYAKIYLGDLSTFVGDVARVKVFRKSRSRLEDFQLINDIRLESVELFRDLDDTRFIEVPYGKFSPRKLNTYWKEEETLSSKLDAYFHNDVLYNSVELYSPFAESSLSTIPPLDMTSDEYTVSMGIRSVGNLVTMYLQDELYDNTGVIDGTKIEATLDNGLLIQTTAPTILFGKDSAFRRIEVGIDNTDIVYPLHQVFQRVIQTNEGHVKLKASKNYAIYNDDGELVTPEKITLTVEHANITNPTFKFSGKGIVQQIFNNSAESELPIPLLWENFNTPIQVTVSARSETGIVITDTITIYPYQMKEGDVLATIDNPTHTYRWYYNAEDDTTTQIAQSFGTSTNTIIRVVDHEDTPIIYNEGWRLRDLSIPTQSDRDTHYLRFYLRGNTIVDMLDDAGNVVFDEAGVVRTELGPVIEYEIDKVEYSKSLLQKFDFVKNFKLDTRLTNVRFYIGVYGLDWYVNNVSLRAAQETSFSPDSFTFIQPVPKILPAERFNYKFEFYDINNNYIPVDVFYSKLFTGGNDFITDDSFRITTSPSFFMFNGDGNVVGRPTIDVTVHRDDFLTGSAVTIISQSIDINGYDIPAVLYGGNPIDEDTGFSASVINTSFLVKNEEDFNYITHDTTIYVLSDGGVSNATDTIIYPINGAKWDATNGIELSILDINNGVTSSVDTANANLHLSVKFANNYITLHDAHRIGYPGILTGSLATTNEGVNQSAIILPDFYNIYPTTIYLVSGTLIDSEFDTTTFGIQGNVIDEFKLGPDNTKSVQFFRVDALNDVHPEVISASYNGNHILVYPSASLLAPQSWYYTASFDIDVAQFITHVDDGVGGIYPGYITNQTDDGGIVSAKNFKGSNKNVDVQDVIYTGICDGLVDTALISAVKWGKDANNYTIRSFNGYAIRNYDPKKQIELQAYATVGGEFTQINDELTPHNQYKLHILDEDTNRFIPMSEVVADDILEDVFVGQSGSGEINYNARFGRDAIEGQLTVYMGAYRNKGTRFVLVDTVDISDVLDGLGAVFIDPSDTGFVRKIDDTYEPTSITGKVIAYPRGETKHPISRSFTIYPYHDIEDDKDYMYYTVTGENINLPPDFTGSLDEGFLNLIWDARVSGSTDLTRLPSGSIGINDKIQTQKLVLTATQTDIVQSTTSATEQFAISVVPKPPKLLTLTTSRTIVRYKKDGTLEDPNIEVVLTANAQNFRTPLYYVWFKKQEGTDEFIQQQAPSLINTFTIPSGDLPDLDNPEDVWRVEVRERNVDRAFEADATVELIAIRDGRNTINSGVLTIPARHFTYTGDVSDGSEYKPNKIQSTFYFERQDWTGSVVLDEDDEPTDDREFDVFIDGTNEFHPNSVYTASVSVIPTWKSHNGQSLGTGASYTYWQHHLLYNIVESNPFIKVSGSVLTSSLFEPGVLLDDEDINLSDYIDTLPPNELYATQNLYLVAKYRDPVTKQFVLQSEEITVDGGLSEDIIIRLSNPNPIVNIEIDGTTTLNQTGLIISVWRGQTKLTASLDTNTFNELEDRTKFGYYNTFISASDAWITTEDTNNPIVDNVTGDAVFLPIKKWSVETPVQSGSIDYDISVWMNDDSIKTFKVKQNFSVVRAGETGPGIVFRGEWTGSIPYIYNVDVRRRDAVLRNLENNGVSEVHYWATTEDLVTGSSAPFTIQPSHSVDDNIPDGEDDIPFGQGYIDAGGWEYLGKQDFFVAAKIAIFEESFVKNTINVGNNVGNPYANIVIQGSGSIPYIAIGQVNESDDAGSLGIGYGKPGIWMGTSIIAEIADEEDGGKPSSSLSIIPRLSLMSSLTSIDENNSRYTGLFWNGEKLIIRGGLFQTEAGVISSINFRGYWSSSIDYNPGDIVTYAIAESEPTGSWRTLDRHTSAFFPSESLDHPSASVQGQPSVGPWQPFIPGASDAKILDISFNPSVFQFGSALANTPMNKTVSILIRQQGLSRPVNVNDIKLYKYPSKDPITPTTALVIIPGATSTGNRRNDTVILNWDSVSGSISLNSDDGITVLVSGSGLSDQDEETILFVGRVDPSTPFYRIVSENGNVILNSDGTIELRVDKITFGGITQVTSSLEGVALYSGSTMLDASIDGITDGVHSASINPIITNEFINRKQVITLRDIQSDTILDSIVLADITDGLPTVYLEYDTSTVQRNSSGQSADAYKYSTDAITVTAWFYDYDNDNENNLSPYTSSILITPTFNTTSYIDQMSWSIIDNTIDAVITVWDPDVSTTHIAEGVATNTKDLTVKFSYELSDVGKNAVGRDNLEIQSTFFIQSEGIDGLDALEFSITNERFNISVDNTNEPIGNNPYTNSGNLIKVFETVNVYIDEVKTTDTAIVELTFSGSGTVQSGDTASSFRIEAVRVTPDGGIEVPTATGIGTQTATIGNLSNLNITNNDGQVKIEFDIVGIRANGKTRFSKTLERNITINRPQNPPSIVIEPSQDVFLYDYVTGDLLGSPTATLTAITASNATTPILDTPTYTWYITGSLVQSNTNNIYTYSPSANISNMPQSVRVNLSDGADGNPIAFGTDILSGFRSSVLVRELYVYTTGSTAPTTPSGGTYNFSSSVLTPPVGWEVSSATGRTASYVSATTVVGSSDAVATDISLSDWSTPILFMPGVGITSLNIIYTSSLAQPPTPETTAMEVPIPIGWFDDPANAKATQEPFEYLWASVGQLDQFEDTWKWSTPTQLEGTQIYFADISNPTINVPYSTPNNIKPVSGTGAIITAYVGTTQLTPTTGIPNTTEFSVALHSNNSIALPVSYTPTVDGDALVFPEIVSMSGDFGSLTFDVNLGGIVNLLKTQTFTKVIDAPKGDPGPGIIFRGEWDSETEYYADGVRTDVVSLGIDSTTGLTNYYYAKTGSTGITPDVGGNATWGEFAGFKAVATDLLFAQEAYVNRSLNVGSSGSTSVITISPDYSNNYANPYISIGQEDSKGYDNDGIYLGYTGSVASLSIKKSNGDNISGLFWDGEQLTIRGAIRQTETGVTINDLNFRGGWAVGVAYNAYDYVSYPNPNNGGRPAQWWTLINHTSVALGDASEDTAGPPPTGSNWQLLLDSGQDGVSGSNGEDAKLLDLTATSLFFRKNGNVYSPAEITFSASLQNITGDTSFTSVPAGVLTVTGNTAVLTSGSFALEGDIPIRVTATAGGISDVVTINLVEDGKDTITAFLTNESHTVPANADGTVTSFAGAAGSFVTMYGGTDISVLGTYGIDTANSTGTFTATIDSNGDYSVTGLETDTAKIKFTASFSADTVVTDDQTPTVLVKDFTITKSKAGVSGSNGEDAKLLDLTATSQIFKSTSGVITPTSIDFTASLQNITGDVSFTTDPSVTLVGSGLTRTLTSANFGNNTTVTVTATTGSFSDSITVVLLKDGESGLQVILSNEVHTLTASSDGTVINFSGSGTTIRVFYGTAELQYETGNTTEAPANGKFRVSISQTNVTSGSTSAGPDKAVTIGDLTSFNQNQDSGQIEFTIRANRGWGDHDVTLTKIQTFSKSKAGVTGPSGNAGSGLIYRGAYTGSATYVYIEGVRRDVVSENTNYYYVASTGSHSPGNHTAPSLQIDGFWSAFDATFSNIATSFILTEDATATGTINVGTNSQISIVGNDANPYISIGQSNKGYGNTGIWLGYDSVGTVSKLSLIGGSNGLKWTGTNLEVTGSINASAGTIGGWDITPASIKKENLTLATSGSNGFITIGATLTQNSPVLRLTDSGNFPLFYGPADGSGVKKFSIDNTGKLTATDTVISGSINVVDGTLGNLSVNGTLTIGAEGSLDWSVGRIDANGVSFNAYPGSGGVSPYEVTWLRTPEDGGGTGAYVRGVDGGGGVYEIRMSATQKVIIGSDIDTGGTGEILIARSGNVPTKILGTNVSTTTTSGALQVAGGIGVASGSYFGGTVTATNFILSSDRRLKSNIIDVTNGLALIDSLQPKKYIKNDKLELGFITDEIPTELDFLVKRDGEYEGLDYTSIIAVLVKSVQELKKELDILKHQ
jgi:hypothetical protein